MLYHENPQAFLRTVRNGILNQGYYVIPQFFSREEAHYYDEVTSHLSKRRVTTGHQFEYGSYDSQSIKQDCILWKVFLNKKLVRIIRLALGLKPEVPLRNMISWLHRYRLGEQIAPHKDAGGDIQLVVLLRKPAPENGGTLFLRLAGIDEPLHLGVGDALLFLASQIEHYSTPLIKSQKEQSPKKIVAVARYYFS